MNSDDWEVLRTAFIFITGILVAFGLINLGRFEAQHSKPTPHQSRIAVCQYLGGTMHGDLCIKDGRVMDTGGK